MNESTGRDGEDAATDAMLRGWADLVVPLAAPPSGFQRVLMRAHRRRARRRLLTSAASALSVVLVFGGLVAGGVIPGMHQGGARCGTGAAFSGSASAGCGGVGAGGPSTGYAGQAAPTNSTTPGTTDPTGNAAPTTGAGVTTKPAVSPGSPSAASPVTGGGKCLTSALSIQVSIVDGSQGMGHELLNVALTNRAGHPCTVDGFPGLQLLEQNLTSQPTTVSRDYSVTPATITLAPGGAAASTVRIDMDIPAGNEPTTGPCEPASYYLAVTAPNNTTHLDALINTGQPSTAGVTVCEQGALDVLPFVAGSTGPNQ